MRRFAYINDELCMSVEALAEALGSSSGVTVKMGMLRHREGSESWRYYEDEADRRRRWIVVEALPEDTYRKMWKAGNPYDRYWTEELTMRLPEFINTEDLAWWMEHPHKGNTGYTKTEAEQLTEACGWLRMLSARVLMEKFSGKLSYYEQTARLLSARNLYGLRVKNSRVLQRRVKKWEKEGRQSLVSGLVGNTNRQKVTESGRLRIIALYADPKKPTATAVKKIYDREAAERGWPKLTTGRIRQIISSSQQLWYVNRHGVEAFRAKHERTLKRRKASFADALWSIDGTTLQLLYQDDGQVKSELYFVLIVDAYSDKIVGWSVGKSETGTLVQAALRSACTRSMQLPFQLQYDNSSANLASEAKQLMDKISRLHFPTTPYNAKAKRVENMIGRLEGQMRYLENFKGGNITSPSIERKANPDYVMQLQKAGKLPDRKGAVAQLELIIETHNTTPGADGLTPNERYCMPSEKRIPLEPLLLVELFWVKRRKPAAYTKDGLEIMVNGRRYTYEVESERGIEDMDWRRVWLGERFDVYYDPEELGVIALYKGEKFINYANQKFEFAEAIVDAEPGEASLRRRALQERRRYIDESIEAMENIGELVESEGFEVFSHRLLHKDTYNKIQGRIENEWLEKTARERKPFRLTDVSEADGSVIE